jgi:flagellar hook protein FlgE
MGISRSLSIGTSSLRANQQRFDVISNNLANTNTVGYKTNRATFEEQLNQIYSRGHSTNQSGGVGTGGINPVQFGLGVKLGSIQQNMQQGTIETTDRPLDLALQGDGFFVYNNNGVQEYSRAGAISKDVNGFFVDSSTGSFLQGYNVQVDATGMPVKDSSGNNILSGKLSNLQISNDVISPPNQTQNVSLSGNLNSAMNVGDTRSTSINIFDNIGGVHTLEVVFTKSQNANEYTLSGTLDGNNITLPSSTVKFNADGTLNSPLTLTLQSSALNTLLGNQSFDKNKNINLQLAPSNQLTSGLTQYSMPNTATFSTQDGYQKGNLQDLSVDKQGYIWGAFSNGKSEIMGQVAFAKFPNQEALVRSGDNMYVSSPNSGDAKIGAVDTFGNTTYVISNALEQSNVDITTQFTDMISTQRAFEAASRTITVTDGMLQELNSLKRV